MRVYKIVGDIRAGRKCGKSISGVFPKKEQAIETALLESRLSFRPDPLAKYNKGQIVHGTTVHVFEIEASGPSVLETVCALMTERFDRCVETDSAYGPVWEFDGEEWVEKEPAKIGVPDPARWD